VLNSRATEAVAAKYRFTGILPNKPARLEALSGCAREVYTATRPGQYP